MTIFWFVMFLIVTLILIMVSREAFYWRDQNVELRQMIQDKINEYQKAQKDKAHDIEPV